MSSFGGPLSDAQSVALFTTSMVHRHALYANKLPSSPPEGGTMDLAFHAAFNIPLNVARESLRVLCESDPRMVQQVQRKVDEYIHVHHLEMKVQQKDWTAHGRDFRTRISRLRDTIVRRTLQSAATEEPQLIIWLRDIGRRVLENKMDYVNWQIQRGRQDTGQEKAHGNEICESLVIHPPPHLRQYMRVPAPQWLFASNMHHGMPTPPPDACYGTRVMPSCTNAFATGYTKSGVWNEQCCPEYNPHVAPRHQYDAVQPGRSYQHPGYGTGTFDPHGFFPQAVPQLHDYNQNNMAYQTRGVQVDPGKPNFGGGNGQLEFYNHNPNTEPQFQVHNQNFVYPQNTSGGPADRY